MLQATKINQSYREKKDSYSDEHCEQGRRDTQILYIVTYDGNESRPGAEKNEDMPAPKQCSGKNRIPKVRTE